MGEIGNTIYLSWFRKINYCEMWKKITFILTEQINLFCKIQWILLSVIYFTYVDVA